MVVSRDKHLTSALGGGAGGCFCHGSDDCRYTGRSLRCFTCSHIWSRARYTLFSRRRADDANALRRARRRGWRVHFGSNWAEISQTMAGPAFRVEGKGRGWHTVGQRRNQAQQWRNKNKFLEDGDRSQAEKSEANHSSRQACAIDATEARLPVLARITFPDCGMRIFYAGAF